MAKVGVFGGTFDPVHTGHIEVALSAQTALKLDKILFVPTNQPVFKLEQHVTNGSERMNQLQQMLKTYPQFEISNVDLTRGGITYTIDTMHDIIEKYPHDELYFIAGADILADLHNWKSLDQILQLCKFVIIARPGYAMKITPDLQKFADKIRLLNIETPDISSTQLRDAKM